MEKEEAIKEIENASDEEVRFGDIEHHYEDVMKRIEAVEMAIKALKQESVLDKIRAEIEQDAFKDVNGSKFIFVNRVNQIIDKYKAESEEEE